MAMPMLPHAVLVVVVLMTAVSGAAPPRATAARRRRLAAEETATRLTSQPLAHARRRPPPRPEYFAPTPECPAELARQVNATGLLPVDMFGNATTTDDDRVRLAIDASRVCGGAIFFLSTPGHISYQFATTVDVPANIVFQGGGWNGVAQFQTPSMAEIGVSAQTFQCLVVSRRLVSSRSSSGMKRRPRSIWRQVGCRLLWESLHEFDMNHLQWQYYSSA